MKRKNIWIISGAVVVIALILAASIFYYNTPFNRFKRALDHGEFSQAETLYQQNIESATFLEKAQLYVETFIDELVQDYLSEELEYADVKDNINNLSFCNNNEDIQTALAHIKDIKKSRTLFASAEKAMASGNFESAINKYESVIEEDKKYYSDSKEKIAQAKESICRAAIDEATKALNNNDSIAAFSILCDVKQEYQNSDIQKLIIEVQKQAMQRVESEITSLVENSEYRQACQFFFSLPAALQSGDLESTKEKVITGLLAQVNEKKSNGDYDAAISLLLDENGELIDESFKEELANCQKSKDILLLETLKTDTYIEYDSIGKYYSIRSLKQISKINDMIGMCNVEKQSAFMGLCFMFESNDWIFADSILIDCDGLQYSFNNLETVDRTILYGTGKICEAYAIFDQYSFVDLNPVISAMAESEKVIVRFSGSRGTKDIVIPKASINKTQTVWSMYQILKRDPSLVSYLQ